MALNKSRMALLDSKPDRPTRTTLSEEDSAVSFNINALDSKRTVRYAWAPGNDKVRWRSYAAQRQSCVPTSSAHRLAFLAHHRSTVRPSFVWQRTTGLPSRGSLSLRRKPSSKSSVSKARGSH